MSCIKRPILPFLFWLVVACSVLEPAMAQAKHQESREDFECYFAQVCKDDGSKCELAGLGFNTSTIQSDAFGVFKNGDRFFNYTQKENSMALIVLPDERAKLIMVERDSTKFSATIFHGVCNAE